MASSSGLVRYNSGMDSRALTHAEVFSDLLSFETDTSLKHLISPQRFSLKSFFSTSVRGHAFSSAEIKALANRIKNWNRYLDTNLYNCLYHYDRFHELKSIAKTLFEKNKTLLIRHQIKKINVQNKSLSEALNRFDDLIIRICSLPLPKKRPDAATYLLNPNQHFLSSSTKKNDPFSVAKARRLTKSDSTLYKKPSQVNYQAATKSHKTFAHTITDMNQRRMQLELLSRHFEMINESHDFDWKVSLIKEFSLLDTKEKIIAVSENLKLTQIFALTESAFSNPENHWKLPFFILSIKLKYLKNLILSIDESELNFLNRLIVRQPEEVEVWINEVFKNLSQICIYTLNDKTQSIDELADNYRNYHNPNKIDNSEITQLVQLHTKLKKKRKFINRLRVLGLNVIYEARVNRDLHDVQVKYKELGRRLSDKPKNIHSAAGNIFEIIHTLVFASNGLIDDDEANGIFAGWNIIEPYDYKNVSLLSNFTEEEIDRLNRGNRTVLYSAAAKYLSDRGISYISDWKRLRIFSPLMLKEYLYYYPTPDTSTPTCSSR